MTKLKISIKSAYGRERYYPACAASKLLAQFAGVQTITVQQMDLLRQLGYTLAVEAPSIPAAVLPSAQPHTHSGRVRNQ